MKTVWENGFGAARPLGSPNKVTSRQRKNRATRYHCAGSVELRTAGTNVRTWGTLADLSATGCYVEMRAAYPVGSRVGLVLAVQDVHLQVSGEVRVSYPFLGMGIVFNPLSQQAQADLEKLLHALDPASAPKVGSAAASPATRDAPSPAASAALISDADRALHLLTEHFRSHVVLTREEFLKLIPPDSSTLTHLI